MSDLMKRLLHSLLLCTVWPAAPPSLRLRAQKSISVKQTDSSFHTVHLPAVRGARKAARPKKDNQ